MPFLYPPALRLLWTSHRPQQRAAAAAAIVQRPLFVCTDYCVHVQHWEYSECVQAAAAQSCGSTHQAACCCAETTRILCAKRCFFVSGSAAGTAAALSRCGRPERRSSCAREEENERRVEKQADFRFETMGGSAGGNVTSLSLPCAMMASAVLRGA